MTITYKIDSIDLKDYGVFISSSEGLISRPKPKQNLSVEWADYNGSVVDLSKRTYEARDIDLDCFIKATSQDDFILKCNSLLNVFDAVGTRRLEVFLSDTVNVKPLVYEVYLSDSIVIAKKWSLSNMLGTFTLKLKEPEPIKRVYSYTRTSDANKTVTMAISSPKLVNVYWGDKSFAYDISGVNQSFTKHYLTNGTFYIIVTGNIDEIASIQTNATLLWTKL